LLILNIKEVSTVSYRTILVQYLMEASNFKCGAF
jgi:hypothetical protein